MMPGADRPVAVENPHPALLRCARDSLDLVGLDRTGDLCSDGDRARPEVELTSRHGKPCRRERSDVADVVVVEVGDQDLVDRLSIDAETVERLERRTKGRPAPALADLDVVARVDENGPPAVAEDPEEVVHLVRGVGLSVRVVAVVALALRRLARRIAHRHDLVDRVGWPEPDFDSAAHAPLSPVTSATTLPA